MSQPEITKSKAPTRPKRESLDGVICYVFSQLRWHFEDSRLGGNFENYLNDRMDTMARDRKIKPKTILNDFLERSKSSGNELEVARMRILCAIDISLYYCFQANRAYVAGNFEKAWFFTTEATKWHGLTAGAENTYRTLRDSARHLASSGGRGRSDSFEPLRTFARQAVTEKNYRSRRNAALSIKPAVLELAQKLRIPLSEQQAEKTITNWLKDIPFASTRGRELADIFR